MKCGWAAKLPRGQALFPLAIVMLAVCCSGGYCKVSAAPRGRIPALILGPQENPEIRTLEVDTPIKREADGNALHLYRIALANGQYLRVVVDQQGADVAVTLIGPDGQRIIKADGPSGSTGPEPISVIAEQTGEYRIEVRL